MEYLDFKTARCKDCFKCLRECPVKAIKFENHQAKIMEDRCILCGKCTTVCPQNAKKVHSGVENIKRLLKGDNQVIASIAPAFVSSFNVQDFSIMKIALAKLGFSDAEETSIGANVVTAAYKKDLETKNYKNYITSACPAINKMIQLYYPGALKYLSSVASPMVVHARMIKKNNPKAKIVFIGPCISKKREADESKIIDGVLTFEELKLMFEEKNIDLNQIVKVDIQKSDSINFTNKAKFYPISRGIIKSFTSLPSGYEYIAVDGVQRSFDILEDIESLSGLFMEINCCEYACINGPCSIKQNGGNLKANEDIRKYVNKSLDKFKEKDLDINIDVGYTHPKININRIIPSERDIKFILEKTGKKTKEDELNCGACGYPTCREKAIAVANGFAAIDMCIPYMRTRAESMSYEIIQNSPNGIIIMDTDYKILECNNKAKNLFGIIEKSIIGLNAYDCFDSSDFMIALVDNKNVNKKKIFIDASKKYVELSIMILSEHKVLFGLLKDITDRVEYDKRLREVKDETLLTTDEVIKKQMRVAQEIASLLGETTAETKVALLKLKKTLLNEENDEV